MKQFFFIGILVAALFMQTAFAQTESKKEAIGPQRTGFEIGTDKSVYYYNFDQQSHEKIRIIAKIPFIKNGQKIEIKSIYSKGPHEFNDNYSICSDSSVGKCFAKLNDTHYFVDSDRQYGHLLGKWALVAKYGEEGFSTPFEITTPKPFELYTSTQKYTIRQLKDAGLQIIFLGSKVSNQTKLYLEIFKIKDSSEVSILQTEVPVEVLNEPPYYEKFPITFPNKVPFDVGRYKITAAWGDLYASNVFEIIEEVPVVDNSQKGGGCLIATAAYGSELAPQVQMLREFREQKIMSTSSGASFLRTFNTMYYSISPTIADAERQNPYLQVIVKAVLYPLIGILDITQKVSVFEGEAGSLSAGFLASTLIGAIYLWPLSLGYNFARFYKKIILVIIAAASLTVLGILVSDSPILMVSTMIFVLSSIMLGLSLVSKVLTVLLTKNKRETN